MPSRLGKLWPSIGENSYSDGDRANCQGGMPQIDGGAAQLAIGRIFSIGNNDIVCLHLFEWEDQVWFPASLRTAMTSYLVAASRSAAWERGVSVGRGTDFQSARLL